ncbi:hypothetical protein [Saccharicrinis sp. GN24d3]|uniref:hypothetical protein n=1 Tax=Saccharicrinis sp. GN24d3 TaxID=3458416 RepID=UPI004035E704
MEKLIFLSMLCLVLVACSNSDDEEVDVPVSVEETAEYKAAEAYYNSTLKSVITASCTSCHAGYHRNSNTSNYGTFTNAMNRATGMYSQVNSGGMPKGGDKLPQDDIDKFEDFKDLVGLIPSE